MAKRESHEDYLARCRAQDEARSKADNLTTHAEEEARRRGVPGYTGDGDIGSSIHQQHHHHHPTPDSSSSTTTTTPDSSSSTTGTSTGSSVGSSPKPVYLIDRVRPYTPWSLPSDDASQFGPDSVSSSYQYEAGWPWWRE